MDAHRSEQAPSETKNDQDPYEAHLVSRNLKIFKAPLAAYPIGILTNTANGRNLRLINPASRAIRAEEVHELTCTVEDRGLGEVVNDVGYLAFIKFPESGVVARGDLLQVDSNELGEVLGFNEVHAPNHINIIIRVRELTTGQSQNWGLKTKLIFVRPFEQGLDSPDKSDEFEKE